MHTAYVGFVISVLYSFFQGLCNVYIGGISGDLHHLDHLSLSILGSLGAYLFLGNGLGCLLSSAFIDRYGPYKVSAVCCSVGIVGFIIFTASSHILLLSFGQLLVGIGVSAYQPAGIKIIRSHFSPERVPTLNGIFFCANALGSACMNEITKLSHMFSLLSLNSLMIASLLLLTLAHTYAMLLTPSKPEKPMAFRAILSGQIQLINNYLVLPAIISQALPELFNYVVLPLWAIPLMKLFILPASASHIFTISLLIYGLGSLMIGIIYHRFFPPMIWMMLQYGLSFALLALFLIWPTTSYSALSFAVVFISISAFLGASNTSISTYLSSLFSKNYTASIIGIDAYISQAIVGIGASLFANLLIPNSSGAYTLQSYDKVLWPLAYLFAFSSVLCLLLYYVEKSYPKPLPVGKG